MAVQEETVDIKLSLAHAFGVYPHPLRDAVIAVGDDAFLFCVGRHVAVCDQSRQRLGFLPRDARNKSVTAMTRSQNGKLLALGERVGADGDAQAVQISIYGLTTSSDPLAILGEPKADQKDAALKVLFPPNKRLDIVGLAFTAEGKILVSLSSMPESTVSYWRWDVEKLVTSHDIQLCVNRLHVNPSAPSQFSVSGPSYLRIWDFNPNDQHLRENPSVFPLKQERQMKVVDHCWILSTFLCAASEDGHVYLFEDGEQRQDLDVLAVIEQHEAQGSKAAEREQAKNLAMLMGGTSPLLAEDPPPVRLSALAAWPRGFVVGGSQGYLGVFIVNTKAQIEPLGTFRIPGEKATIWQMSGSTEDGIMTVLSYEEQDASEVASAMPVSRRGDSAGKRSSLSGTSQRRTLPNLGGSKWSLSTFPIGQAELAATGQLEVFSSVFAGGNHHGKITAMASGWSRRIVATCGEDKQLKVWRYPAEESDGQAGVFTSELSVQASPFEIPTAIAVHPLGFQIALILEDMLRIFHLTPQQATRTHFDLLLKHPGGVAYSSSGNLLAVSSENDVALIDPWRAIVTHMFTGRAGHLSPVNQVLFSEDDRLLLASATAPHGALFGWDLTSPTKDRCFEHVSKMSSYISFGFDFKRRLAVGCTRPEGSLRVINHLSFTEVACDSKTNMYSSLALAVPLGLLFVGTEQGSVRVFRWPLPEAGANFFTEIPLHSSSITSMSLSYDARYLFTAGEDGAVLACEVTPSVTNSDQTRSKISSLQLDEKFVKFRYSEGRKAIMDKADRKYEEKVWDLQKKLWDSVRGISATKADLDDMLIVPKNYFGDVLTEIRELEDRMTSLKHENDRTLEQKENEFHEKLMTLDMERKMERQVADDKYDNLFLQLKQANTRHAQEVEDANKQFDSRNWQLQDNFEASISKEYSKQSRLLEELQTQRDLFEDEKSKMKQSYELQLNELRASQEKAIREWRAEYDKVCNLLKSDGLKFEEALRQQESEYEGQITEMLEHKRMVLHAESEKATMALKDGMSMKQTIHMLQNQVKSRDVELTEAIKLQEDLKKKLQASQEMSAKVREQLKERERSLKVKDESLCKLREQMKHLESFRFVLFHKVRALEEERDPLEEQVNSLKSSVREMYSEFVKEFRQKQKMDQQLSDKTSLSSALQSETLDLRSQLSQLKKDGKRLLQDVEGALYVESTSEMAQIPKRIQAVLERHKKMVAWKPPEDDNEPRTAAYVKKKEILAEEVAVQRNLLLKKTLVARASANQTKQECATDIRRLTSENSQLIAEMNRLRDENRSYVRSCKEMQSDILALKAKKQREVRGGPSASLTRAESAPDFSGSQDDSGMTQAASSSHRLPPNGRPLPKDTPYVRRKTVDQQENLRRQHQKQLNQLPPVVMQSSSFPEEHPKIARSEEQRFMQSLESLRADRQQMEDQGFAVSNLTEVSMAGIPSEGEGAD